MPRLFKTLAPFLIIVFLAFPIIFPFLKAGFFVSHDGEWAVVRFGAFHFAAKDGQIPPRWAGNLFHGYGYPVLNFNYPLPYYLAELFHLLRFGFVDSVKLVFIISVIFSGIFIYLFVKHFWGKLPGLAAAIFYLYVPFRFVNLYVRGSFGESLSFAILPLVFFSLTKLIESKNKFWLLISSTSLGLMILSHNVIALISLPVIFLYGVYLVLNQKKKKLVTCYLLLVTCLGFSLSAFFWLPALIEKKYTYLDKMIVADPTDHFPTINQLVIPSWSYKSSIKGSNEELSFQIGPLHLLTVLVTVGIFFFKRVNKLSLFFLLSFLISLLSMLPGFSLVYKHLPLFDFIGYPWRFLILTAFSSSFLAGFLFSFFKGLKWGILLAIFSLILFSLSKDYRHPKEYVDRGDMFYLTNQATTDAASENMPIWVKVFPKEAPKEKIEVDGEYKIEKEKSNLLVFSLKTIKPQKVFVNKIYYPGWRVFVNEKEERVDFNNENGIISFDVPAGKSEIKLIFGETPLRLTADLISLGSLIFIVRLGFKPCRGVILNLFQNPNQKS